MKKITEKQRNRDVQRLIDLRNRPSFKKNIRKKRNYNDIENSWKDNNTWIDENKNLNFEVNKRRELTLYLPSKMNFSSEYEVTTSNLIAIRKIAGIKKPGKAYKLKNVNFDNLSEISTSAALVLTAELSRWDDHIRNMLRPNTTKWDKSILQHFREIGFFDLFTKNENNEENQSNSPLNIVKYIKGSCGDASKTRKLKDELVSITKGSIDKWIILNSGLHEAITNVSHHAYPDSLGCKIIDRNWYLTGSYNKVKKQLKIVFYDQGIGIPRSLPASKFGEKVLKSFSLIPYLDRFKDEVLLKAAVEADRTRTLESDRGKGLPDLLDFIKERGEGYLSIMSQKALYKYSMINGQEMVKSESFKFPIQGTLIIWCVSL